MSGLSDRVVLEVDPIDGAEDTGVFVLRTDLDTTDEGDRSFLMDQRGQYVSQIAEIAGAFIPDELEEAAEDVDRREGVTIDGGAGRATKTITATRGAEETARWGDGSADGYEGTMYDAARGDLDGHVDVLDYWLNQTRSDSQGQTRLHLRGHTDGSYSDEPGVFGEPYTVAIKSHTISKEDHTEISVTLEMDQTAIIPSVDEALEGFDDAIDAVVDSLDEYTQEWMA